MSLGMEMPEDTLSNVHRYDAKGESYGEFIPISIATTCSPESCSSLHEVVSVTD